MTTKRKKTKSISREGINYLRAIVEGNNCIFQEIELENDVGNDAYIEFIVNEESTSFCIAVQVKSGTSSKRKKYYSLKSDKDHFEYWNNHNLPICGIVFDTQNQVAVWVDITHYLEENTEKIKSGPYSIPIQHNSILNRDNFMEFVDYYLKYQDVYKNDSNFCKSLDYFASLNNEMLMYDGAKSLFFNHRNRNITWFVLINCYSTVDYKLLFDLTLILCHVPGHGDIWWSDKNIINDTVRTYAKQLIQNMFKKNEVTRLLSVVDENGFGRGTIGQCVESIISIIPDKTEILKEITFDYTIDEDKRIEALILLLYYISENKTICEEILNEYLHKNPHSIHKEIVYLFIEQLNEYGEINIY